MSHETSTTGYTYAYITSGYSSDQSFHRESAGSKTVDMDMKEEA